MRGRRDVTAEPVQAWTQTMRQLNAGGQKQIECLASAEQQREVASQALASLGVYLGAEDWLLDAEMGDVKGPPSA